MNGKVNEWLVASQWQLVTSPVNAMCKNTSFLRGKCMCNKSLTYTEHVCQQRVRNIAHKAECSWQDDRTTGENFSQTSRCECVALRCQRKHRVGRRENQSSHLRVTYSCFIRLCRYRDWSCICRLLFHDNTPVLRSFFERVTQCFFSLYTPSSTPRESRISY